MNFMEKLNQDIINFSEIEETKLMDFLREHFELIEKYIESHKKINIKLAKQNGKLSNLDDKVYNNLAKNIIDSEEKFKGYKISGDNLAKYISKIRIEKDCKKQHKTKRLIEENSKPLLSDKVLTNKTTTVRLQKQINDEQSSEGEKSQQASQVGNLSTVQVAQAPLKELLTPEDEEILLNLKKINFNYSQLINSLDKNANLDKNYGVYEQEQKMEELTKVIFKLFGINYPNGKYDILSDAQKRSEKFSNLEVSEPIKKLGAQIWSRVDLINMLMDRYKLSIKNK